MQIEQSSPIQQQQIKLPIQQNYITFTQPRQPNIFFDSRFDSGNMHQTIRNSFQHYSIWTASDCQGMENQGYAKSWFYFRVGGFCNRRVSFSIHRMHFLWAVSKKDSLYRPVYRIHEKNSEGEYHTTQWSRLPHPIISLALNSQEQLVLKFDFVFLNHIQWVQFAFIYPYTYQTCRQDINKYSQQYLNDKDLFFKNYQLCKSVQNRVIDIVVISSHEGKQGYQGIKNDQVMTLGGQRLTKFKHNKPIVFISARVHPIETPSSFCMKGIIQFLLDKNDFRAYLLRKYFVFVLVPMINIDGVVNGHCRMDTLNQNLNRYYKTPDAKKQPACYSIRKLCEHYNKDKRIFMYLDLHSHPACKGNFIFGNAIFDYIQQVQSHLFPKLISNNCINFQFQQCNFSRRHMKAKDKFQDMSKQGSGRVVFYKDFGIIHSYTLQCGYHCNLYNNQLEQPKNTNNQYMVKYKLNQKGEKIYEQSQKLQTTSIIYNNGQQKKQQLQQRQTQTITDKNIQKHYDIFKFTQDYLDDINNKHYQKDVVLFSQKTFTNLGRNILISILDIWNKNPYTRIIQLHEQRKQIAEKQAKLDRFKKQQSGIKTKQKKVVELIEEHYYQTWHKRNVYIAQIHGQVQKKVSAKNTQKTLQNQHILKGKSSYKIRRNEKITSTIDNKNIDHKNTSNNQIQQHPKSLNQIPQTYNKSNLHKNSSSFIAIFSTSNNIPIIKLAQSKNNFKPLNMRIRNLMTNGTK